MQADSYNHTQRVEQKSHCFILYCLDNVAVVQKCGNSLRHLSNRMQEDCEMCDHTGKLGQLSDSLTRN